MIYIDAPHPKKPKPLNRKLERKQDDVSIDAPQPQKPKLPTTDEDNALIEIK